MDFTDPNGRTAHGAEEHAGPVTLINRGFVVPEGRDEAFLERWTETSRYFRAQPGFVIVCGCTGPCPPTCRTGSSTWRSGSRPRTTGHPTGPRSSSAS